MSRAREAANWIATGVTGAEIDKLDGFTGTVDDLNYAKDLRATGVTATEFDKLDGFTGTVDDLNYAKDLRATGVTDAEFDHLDTTSGTPGSSNYLRGDKTWATITMPTTGISDGNTLVANANVADDDFLRVDGTSIEGRTAAETLGDIGAAPLASPTFTGNVALGSNATGTFAGTVSSSATIQQKTALVTGEHYADLNPVDDSSYLYTVKLNTELDPYNFITLSSNTVTVTEAGTYDISWASGSMLNWTETTYGTYAQSYLEVGGTQTKLGGTTYVVDMKDRTGYSGTPTDSLGNWVGTLSANDTLKIRIRTSDADDEIYSWTGFTGSGTHNNVFGHMLIRKIG